MTLCFPAPMQDLVDSKGLQDLALSRGADELGVQASALYNHVAGLDGRRQAADSWRPAGGLIPEVLARILETYGATGHAAVHLARIVRSAIHGFVTLETSQSFTSPQDTDASFDELLDFVIKGLNDHGKTAAVA